jgi:8-oxo-dGTP pyrophosphatase MutT (NUDIX family)
MYKSKYIKYKNKYLELKNSRILKEGNRVKQSGGHRGTTSVAVVNYAKTHVLLHKRSNTVDDGPGKLGLPGGSVDPGEYHDIAAARELAEEAQVMVNHKYVHAKDLKYVHHNNEGHSLFVYRAPINGITVLGPQDEYVEEIDKTWGEHNFGFHKFVPIDDLLKHTHNEIGHKWLKYEGDEIWHYTHDDITKLKKWMGSVINF